MKIKNIIYLAALLTLLNVYQTNAQKKKVYKGDPDVSFATARTLAFDQKHKQAQDTLQHILTKYPDYHDVRNFLATTYSWDGEYKKSKDQFEYVLGKDSKNTDAWHGIIQNDLWGDSPATALELANKALINLPDNTDILLLKANAQEKINDLTGAAATIKTILEKEPDNQKAKDFRNSLTTKANQVLQNLNNVSAPKQTTYKGDPDASFATARNLAFNQLRKQSQDTLQNILTKYPDYHEIRTFLATTYSWDSDYKKAKKEFEYVLEKDPKNKAAWQGIIQNELWADTPFIALELSDKALTNLPGDTDILLLKADAQEKTNNPMGAAYTIDTILKKEPENKKAKAFKISLNTKLNRNSIGITASADFYSDTFTPMQYYSLKYARQTKHGTVIARFNFNRRFDTNAQQFEMDMYPKIVKGLYGYVNAGISDSPLFPKTKYGAELFKTLPHSLEASLGFRSLIYDTTTNIYTGSLGWYVGNNYWMFRSYVTPGDSGTSVSGAINYRKYRGGPDDYFAVAVGMGYSPEINQFNYSSIEQQKFNLKSQKINLGYYFMSPDKQHAFGTQFGVTHQEKGFSPGNYFWIYFFAVQWELRYR